MRSIHGQLRNHTQLRRKLAVMLTVMTLLASHGETVIAQAIKADRGMVASVNPVATEAGIDALRAGGNAVDAAVATALTLGVVDGHNSGLGGGCFVLIRTAAGKVVAIDGRETAPASATRDMFTKDGEVVPGLSTTGPLAVGVPGAFAAYAKAVEQHGKLPLQRSLLAAAKIADRGFTVDRVYARNLRETQSQLEKFDASRDMLLKKQDNSSGASYEPYQEGETLRLTDLAESYRSMAEHGTEWFYRGEFARATANWMKHHGGLLTAEDFQSYTAKSREPIRTSYREYEIIGFPPPSSGGIHVAQILNILEHFPLRDLLKDNPAQAHHIIAEAMKLAFADRAHWLGDADFAKVPRGLVDKTYSKQLADRIDSQRCTTVAAHGLPPEWQSNVYGKHTTHIATADKFGNWVAITATVNTSFGSKVVVPGTGVVLNNEMDDFSSRPGVPNAFGLIGAEANAVAPGKRPLSSMSPTIVLKNGKPVMTVGGAGGPKIITEVLLAIIRFVDGSQDVHSAIAAPRIHHQWRPDTLFVEASLDADLIDALRDYGHKIQILERAGVAQAIGRMPNGQFMGQSDPRVPGKAAGF